MLAHLKAKHREELSAHKPEGVAASPPSEPVVAVANPASIEEDFENNDTKVTCDVLCSLSASYPLSTMDSSPEPSLNEGGCGEKRKSKTCPKQHQLPMFLSKTYHMIDRCDHTIATWSAVGDNFVVKNVEKFASNVLPLYFKHSNFSSFARQLNFYGFRKLRTDPILTSDVDPRTACYVRFYHEKFQKDRPELLHQIKRATKSDQQSKDDVESLKVEVCKLRDCIGQMSTDMDRKLAEMSYEYNRRITNLSAEYDKLTALVTQVLAHQQQHNPDQAASLAAAAPTQQVSVSRVPDLMHSLSQVAAMSLQHQLRPPPASRSLVAPPPSIISLLPAAAASGSKRSAIDEAETPSSRARTD